MNDYLEDFSAPAITMAIEANLWAYWSLFGLLPGAELHDEPDLLWVLTDIPIPLFNGVVRTRLAPEAADAAIVTVLHRAASRKVPLMWVVGPTTQPADLGRSLIAHGLLHVGDDPGMAVDLDKVQSSLPPPKALRIERVNDLATLRTWCSFTDQEEVSNALFELFSTIGFGLDRPIQNYLGWLDGEPVATASLVLAAGVAGICNVMTVPQAQRQGIGTMMTVAPLREARSLGYRVGVLQSSKLGLGVYLRLGFQEYCSVGLYLWPGNARKTEN